MSDNQIVQITGQATDLVMSQKAVTDALNLKIDNLTFNNEIYKKADKSHVLEKT